MGCQSLYSSHPLDFALIGFSRRMDFSVELYTSAWARYGCTSLEFPWASTRPRSDFPTTFARSTVAEASSSLVLPNDVPGSGRGDRVNSCHNGGINHAFVSG